MIKALKLVLIFVILLSCKKEKKISSVDITKKQITRDVTQCIDNCKMPIIQKVKELSLSKNLDITIKDIKLNTIKNPLLIFNIEFLNNTKYSCKEVTLRKESIEILFWIFSFENNDTSCLLTNKLNNFRLEKGMNKTMLRKNFIGYKRYNNSLLILKRNFYDNKIKKKYSKLFKLTPARASLVATPCSR